MSDTLARLPHSQPCGCEFQMHGELTTCSQPAYWLLNGCPVCDEDIREIAGMNSDNRITHHTSTQEWMSACWCGFG